MGLATIACFERGFDFTPEWLRSELAKESPSGFVLNASAAVIRLSHGTEFRCFAGERDQRELMRRVFFDVARMVGSRRALYMHEQLPTGFEDGVTLDQMEGRLRWDFGAPSATFEKLGQAENFGPHCWYIDDFADLGTPAGPPYR